MTATQDITSQYERDGFVCGIDIFSAAEIEGYRLQFDELERREGREKCQIGLKMWHLKKRFIWDMATDRRLLDAVCADMSIQTRINDAYEKTGAEKLVWKDSFANGKGGDTVDQKRVLDLAAHRIAAIAATAPEVAAELGAPLTDSLAFFRQVAVSDSANLDGDNGEDDYTSL